MADVKADLQHRIERVQAAMAERGYGGLIIYYGAQHNMLRTDPILLLADFRAIGPCALLLRRTGAPSLILELLVLSFDPGQQRRESADDLKGDVVGVERRHGGLLG